MSPKDVRALMPDAIDPKKIANLNSGAMEFLQIEDFVVVHRHFSVHFYFSDKKLEQVTLKLKRREEDTFHFYMQTFDSFSEALRAKYGAEVSKDKKDYDGYRRVEAMWMSGRTNIGILLFDVYGSLLLNVNYQVRISKESEKL